MYVVYETLEVNGGRQREVEERLAWGHSLMPPLPGFVDAYVLKYRGNPNRYQAVRTWEDRSSFAGWEASEGRAQYLANRPEGLYQVPPLNEFFETVCDRPAAEGATFVARLEYRVAGGQQARFEERERAAAEFLAQQPGFCSMRTLKFLGNPNRYLRLALWTDPKAHQAGQQAAQSEFRATNSDEGLYLTPPEAAYYDVVHALRRT